MAAWWAKPDYTMGGPKNAKGGLLGCHSGPNRVLRVDTPFPEIQ